MKMHCSGNKISNLFLISGLLLLMLSACKEESKPEIRKGKKLSAEESIEMNRRYLQEDQGKIREYIKSKGLVMQQTGTGLWYQIQEEGSGPLCRTGNRVTLACRIYLLDGTLWYDSSRQGLKTFEVGYLGEAGLEEGILMLRENSRALFIMPPHLAYGLSGDQEKVIPPRSVLIYEVKVLSVD